MENNYTNSLALWMMFLGVMALLLSSGIFDNMSDTISLEKLPLENKFMKNPLPSKWYSNLHHGFVVCVTGSNYSKTLF